MFQKYSFYDLLKNPYKKDLEEARRREELGRKIIADQRKKIYELEEKVKELTEKISNNNIKK